MNTTTKVLVGVLPAAVLGAPLLMAATYAVTDMNDNNNITCTGNPHDKNDEGNPHEPRLEEGNPHFCPPIGPNWGPNSLFLEVIQAELNDSIMARTKKGADIA